MLARPAPTHSGHVLRTDHWLIEDNSPRHDGRLFDCGASRDGTGYRDVTDSRALEVVAARAQFAGLLNDLPAPRLDHDGAPNEKNDSDSRRGARQAKNAAKKAKTP